MHPLDDHGECQESGPFPTTCWTNLRGTAGRPTRPTAPAGDAASTIAHSLGCFVGPDRVVEIRAPRAMRPGRRKPVTGSPRFRGDQLLEAAREALQYCWHVRASTSPSNPVRSGLDEMGRPGRPTRDILGRRWLLIDCDPIRPADCRAPTAEKMVAQERPRRSGTSWPPGAGRGRSCRLRQRVYLLYGIKTAGRRRWAGAGRPRSLAATGSTSPPARWTGRSSTRRGSARLRHRVTQGRTRPTTGRIGSRPVEVPPEPTVVPEHLLRALVADLMPPRGAIQIRPGCSRWERPEVVERARAYLRKCDPAISGREVTTGPSRSPARSARGSTSTPRRPSSSSGTSTTRGASRPGMRRSLGTRSGRRLCDREEARLDARCGGRESSTAQTRSADDDDDSVPIPVRTWPAPPDAGLSRAPGRYCPTFEPHTEADPLGLLTQGSVCSGTCRWQRPALLVEDTHHSTNEFVVHGGPRPRSAAGHRDQRRARAGLVDCRSPWEATSHPDRLVVR